MPRVRPAILACIRTIPPGRVMSYGDIAEFVGIRSGRVVGNVLGTYNADRDEHADQDLPWHRVVRADGTCADHKRAEQMQRLRAEGVPFTRGRVDLNVARWDGRAAR